MLLEQTLNKIRQDFLLANKTTQRDFNYGIHAKVVKEIAGEDYVIDENNKRILKLLLYYFNGSPEFENLFDEENYSLKKGLMLVGKIGNGKTSLMKIYNCYCEHANLPEMKFKIVDVRDVTSYFQRNGNIDKYTFNYSLDVYKNEKQNIKHFCFDDIGTELNSVKYFGTDSDPISELFLDRYRIFISHRKLTHITTNLGIPAIIERYGERISDRMKEMFNVIHVSGDSRRK